MTSGLRANGVGPIDHLERRDAHRASGAMHKFHILRQQRVQTVFDDGVGLTAADLHQHPRARGGSPDFVRKFLRDLLIPVFVKVLHDPAPPRHPGAHSIDPSRTGIDRFWPLLPHPVC